MDRIQKRFDALSKAVAPIDASKSESVAMGMKIRHIDVELAMQWRTSVSSLLSRVFGNNSATFQEFKAEVEREDGNNTLARIYPRLKGMFLSAKDQFENGSLFDVRKLIHADVFDDELQQAEYFLNDNWKIPALVIAGTVLESTLRELCEQNGVVLPRHRTTIGPMNDELAKVGVYNKAMKTQILNWGQNRNSAAHGIKDELDALSKSDISRMIDGIRDFVATRTHSTASLNLFVRMGVANTPLKKWMNSRHP